MQSLWPVPANFIISHPSPEFVYSNETYNMVSDEQHDIHKGRSSTSVYYYTLDRITYHMDNGTWIDAILIIIFSKPLSEFHMLGCV